MKMFSAYISPSSPIWAWKYGKDVENRQVNATGNTNFNTQGRVSNTAVSTAMKSALENFHVSLKIKNHLN